MKELKIRPLTEEERKYTYAQSMQLDGQTGNIGYLRGDFGSSGKQFFFHMDGPLETLQDRFVWGRTGRGNKCPAFTGIRAFGKSVCHDGLCAGTPGQPVWGR